MIRRILPPIMLDGTRWVRGVLTGRPPRAPVWQCVPEGWSRQTTDPKVRGWNVPEIRDWHRERFHRWSSAFEQPRPLGTSEYASDPDQQHLHSHNVNVSFAYVLGLAASGRDRLSILDWGGGIGQHYLLARAVLPNVELAYTCADLPLLCEAGRELIPQVTFSEDDGCLEYQYDFVFASNSLQYREDWRDLLARLASSTREHVYIAQLPSLVRTPSIVAVQRPYAHGFATEYLGWILNRDDFLETVAAVELELVREFFFGHELSVSGIDEPAVHRGFLLRSNAR